MVRFGQNADHASVFGQAILVCWMAVDLLIALWFLLAIVSSAQDTWHSAGYRLTYQLLRGGGLLCALLDCFWPAVHVWHRRQWLRDAAVLCELVFDTCFVVIFSVVFWRVLLLIDLMATKLKYLRQHYSVMSETGNEQLRVGSRIPTRIAIYLLVVWAFLLAAVSLFEAVLIYRRENDYGKSRIRRPKMAYILTAEIFVAMNLLVIVYLFRRVRRLKRLLLVLKRMRKNMVLLIESNIHLNLTGDSFDEASKADDVLLRKERELIVGKIDKMNWKVKTMRRLMLGFALYLCCLTVTYGVVLAKGSRVAGRCWLWIWLRSGLSHALLFGVLMYYCQPPKGRKEALDRRSLAAARAQSRNYIQMSDGMLEESMLPIETEPI